MSYFEQELVFVKKQEEELSRGLFNQQLPIVSAITTETLGVTLKIGNRPLVYNFSQLLKKSKKNNVSHNSQSQNQTSNYLIVHTLSALLTKGNASIEELQYFATASFPSSFQTIDLIPKTKFNEILKANINVIGALSATGETLLEMPSHFLDELIAEYVNIGSSLQLQLSSTANFVGKFTYSKQLPIIQSAGIGSNTCAWILKPNETNTPLLGDQLLIQSISVPFDCEKITYKIHGAAKVSKAWLWKQQELKTDELTVEINLKDIN